MSRLVLSMILTVGLAACAAAPGASTAGSSQTTPTTDPSGDPSTEPTDEVTPESSVGPADLVLTEADVPEGFTLASEEDITIASEVEDYGAEAGPAREAALTDRGFVAGARSAFSRDSGGIVSEAWVFDNAEGARAEFDELSGLYVGACPDEIDTGGTIGDVTATWVCPPSALPPRQAAAVIFVQDGVLIVVKWVNEGAEQPSNQQLVADLARILEGRIPS